MKIRHTFFETKPTGGRVGKKTYATSSLVLGRACIDIALISEGSLILVERSVEPAKGLWTAGGRIQWEKFASPFQYGAVLAREHFNIAVQQKHMVLLAPHFLCFKKRPYPEILLWIAIKISPTQISRLSKNSAEHSGLHMFKNIQQLRTHLRSIKATRQHTDALLGLWKEIESAGLLR